MHPLWLIQDKVANLCMCLTVHSATALVPMLFRLRQGNSVP
jgi:hypothetical protein